MNKLITGAISAVGIIAAVTATAPTASAAPPTTKVQALPAGWTDMSVKPAGIYFGQGGAPFITSLHWSYWHNAASAYAGSGTLHVQAPNCQQPSYKCPYVSEPATVYLYTVKDHRTLHYFYNMVVKFRHNGALHRAVGAFKPFWIFPAAWPYL
jgi:hypothetical protein